LDARLRSPRGLTAARVRSPVINVSSRIRTLVLRRVVPPVHQRYAVRVEQTPVRYTVNISVPAMEADVDAGGGGGGRKRRWGLKAEWVNERASLRARATSVCR